MAKTKSPQVDVVNSSDAIAKEEAKKGTALQGANVVSVVSCLERPRKFFLESQNTYIEIPSALSVDSGNAILRADGRSLLFTMERSIWEELKALYSNLDAFENKLICECTESEYTDKDRQKELASKETGYEAQPAQNAIAN